MQYILLPQGYEKSCSFYPPKVDLEGQIHVVSKGILYAGTYS